MYPFRQKVETARSAFLAYLVWGLVFAMVVQAFIFKPYSIAAGSMDPNLVRGDSVLVSKWAYGWSKFSLPFGLPLIPGRLGGGAGAPHGDLVVFKLPRDGATTYASRVIGRPGDTVVLASGRLTVNGHVFGYEFLPQTEAERRKGVRRANETNAEGRRYEIYLKDCPPTDRPQTFVVPMGDYFVLGDKRDDSLDSRFSRDVGVGFVPEANLEGRVELITTSWTERAALVDLRSWFAEARFGRFFSHPV
jgi:signal peptidase I